MFHLSSKIDAKDRKNWIRADLCPIMMDESSRLTSDQETKIVLRYKWMKCNIAPSRALIFACQIMQ